jgi:hypothetical protein
VGRAPDGFIIVSRCSGNRNCIIAAGRLLPRFHRIDLLWNVNGPSSGGGVEFTDRLVNWEVSKFDFCIIMAAFKSKRQLNCLELRLII